MISKTPSRNPQQILPKIPHSLLQTGQFNTRRQKNQVQFHVRFQVVKVLLFAYGSVARPTLETQAKQYLETFLREVVHCLLPSMLPRFESFHDLFYNLELPKRSAVQTRFSLSHLEKFSMRTTPPPPPRDAPPPREIQKGMVRSWKKR